LVANALSEVNVVHIGSIVTFICDTTDMKTLQWDFSSASYSSQTRTLYWSEALEARHSVLHNNLTIENVQLCDAGVYRCWFVSGDNFGTDNFELLVVGG